MLERMRADVCQCAWANVNVMMPHTNLPFDAQTISNSSAPVGLHFSDSLPIPAVPLTSAHQ